MMGTMNELAGEFNGMDRFEARKAVTKELEEIAPLLRFGEDTHSVGHLRAYRSWLEPGPLRLPALV